MHTPARGGGPRACGGRRRAGASCVLLYIRPYIFFKWPHNVRSLIVLIILIQKAKAPKDFLVACYVTQPLYFILRERLMVGGRCGPLAGRLLGKGCRGGALGVAQGWLLKVPFWQLLGLFDLAQLASRNIPQGATGKG